MKLQISLGLQLHLGQSTMDFVQTINILEKQQQQKLQTFVDKTH